MNRREAAISGLLSGLAAIAAIVGIGANVAVLPYLLLAVATGPLVLIDLREHRLPNAITLPLLPLIALLLLVSGDTDAWVRALIGGVILGLGYLVLHLINPRGMGMGDVKLAPTLGMALAWLSWQGLFWGAFGGFAVGALVSLALLALRRASLQSEIPFGPFMLVGTWLAIGASGSLPT